MIEDRNTYSAMIVRAWLDALEWQLNIEAAIFGSAFCDRDKLIVLNSEKILRAEGWIE